MKIHGILAALALPAVLAACTSAQGYLPSELTDADRAVMDRAFTVHLADPQSAQTRDIQVFQAPNGNRSICGLVNAKNAFGGYIGFQPFIVQTVGSVDYSSPYARPIFGTGLTASVDCRGAGYVPAI